MTELDIARIELAGNKARREMMNSRLSRMNEILNGNFVEGIKGIKDYSLPEEVKDLLEELDELLEEVTIHNY